MSTRNDLEQALVDALGRYLDGVGDLCRSGLRFARDLRCTDDGQEVPLEGGVRATLREGGAPALVVADPVTGNVAGWGLVRDAAGELCLCVRLALRDGEVVEVEQLALRRPPMGGPSFSDHLRTGGRFEVLAEDAVASRQSLLAAAHGYFDGVALGDPAHMAVAPECLRFENGVQTVRNPERVGIPDSSPVGDALGLGVTEQIATGDFRYIEAIRDRVPLAVDERRGLVLMRCFFDHPGQQRDSPYTSPLRTPNSMMAWEVFRVEQGLIRFVEAILTPFPYGMRSGW